MKCPRAALEETQAEGGCEHLQQQSPRPKVPSQGQPSQPSDSSGQLLRGLKPQQTLLFLFIYYYYYYFLFFPMQIISPGNRFHFARLFTTQPPFISLVGGGTTQNSFFFFLLETQEKKKSDFFFFPIPALFPKGADSWGLDQTGRAAPYCVAEALLCPHRGQLLLQLFCGQLSAIWRRFPFF